MLPALYLKAYRKDPTMKENFKLQRSGCEMLACYFTVVVDNPRQACHEWHDNFLKK